MFIADSNDDWVPIKNHTRKGIVNDVEVINKIRALGVKFLYIDTAKGKDVGSDEVCPVIAPSDSAVCEYHPMPTPQSTLANEMTNARAIHSEAIELVSRCMLDISSGAVLDTKSLTNMSSQIVDSLMQNHNALSCLTQLRQKDRYLMEHSFNVSVLMGILAVAMGYRGDLLHELVTGALLHDMGKIRVSDEVLHKPGKLTADEWAEMKKHVAYGEEVLRNTPLITPIMLDICAQHHERMDGNGYPRGLKGDKISIYSRMASIVDVYDAITADRVYHKGIAPTLALKKILLWSTEGHLDRSLVCIFIQAMGIYPVGSLVELDKQTLAVVTELNDDEPNKPKVTQIYDLALKRYINKLSINLADERCTRHIVKAVYAEDVNVDVTGFLTF